MNRLTSQNLGKVKELFDPKEFIENAIEEIKKAVDGKKVISACSGGVDSTVATFLVHKAAGKNLTAVFIDDGLRTVW